MKIAFMFSPQGAQYTGMGKDLYENYDLVKRRIDEANALLPYDLKEVLFENEALLNETRYVQTALFVLSTALRDLMRNLGVVSKGSVGLSLGEYAALYDQEVFSFETGLSIIESRAKAMDEATKHTEGSMAAVRSDLETLKPMVDSIDDLYIANYNLENQYVISGSKDAINHFMEISKENGIRRVRLLKTAGAFHSPFMEKAARIFKKTLDCVALSDPKGAIYLNTTGQIYQNNLKNHMVNQMTAPVKFYPAIQTMIEDGYDTFIELGVKNTLSAMVKKINKDVFSLHVEDQETLHTVLKELGYE